MNYNNKMWEIIDNLSDRPKLLLHSCCGPCSTTVLSILKDYFDVTVLYYNPNIEPKEEYEKRKREQIKFIQALGSEYVKFRDIDYDNATFRNSTKGLEDAPEGGVRCTVCFKLRLSKTAEIALKEGYQYFGTTLTVSPHKNSEVINKIGALLEREFGVKYLYSDFKKKDGYKKSIILSKEYDLYRQDYCGCEFGKVRSNGSN